MNIKTSKLLEKVKNFFKLFHWAEILYLSIGLISVIVLSIIAKSSALTIFFSIFAIIYVGTLAVGLKISIVFGIIQSILYIIQSFLNRNYGEAILNVAIVLPLLLASLYSWLKGSSKQSKVESNKISISEWLCLFIVAICLTIALFFVLNALNTPNLLIACLSAFFTIIGNYLLMRKSIYMFLFFTCLNIIALLLWLLPIINGQGQSFGNIPIVIVFAVFTLSNLFGFINWKREEKSRKRMQKEN